MALKGARSLTKNSLEVDLFSQLARHLVETLNRVCYAISGRDVRQ